jgi:hypothetical protein
MDNNTHTKTIYFTFSKKNMKIRKRIDAYYIHQQQKPNHLQFLENMNMDGNDTDHAFLIKEIQNKIQGYKYQDIKKNHYQPSLFIDFSFVIQLMNQSQLKCFYCNKDVFIFYENVLDQNQWTIDRIDNSCGHNKNNSLLSCLKCNLQRKRQNSHSFLFTKKLIINKLES